MINYNSFTIYFICLCIASVTTADLSKIFTVACRSKCKDGLETYISNNCFGTRGCKSIIELFYPNCTRCFDDILDQSNYEIVNGNYHLVCDPNDDLQVNACLFYCRFYYYPVGHCVKQNNIPICRCLDKDTNINPPITTDGNLLNVFSKPTLQSVITQFVGNSFQELVGFEMYSASNTVYYYVIDYGGFFNGESLGRVYILNDSWMFISYKSFDVPTSMITVGTSLYMTGQVNIWKLDKDLNTLIQYNSTDFSLFYFRLCYNPTNGLIYVSTFNEIHAFDLNLNFKRNISTSPHEPISITESSNQLYVGTNEGIILVYYNEIIINQFNGCDGNSATLTSILFDQNGYMATSCDSTNRLYLYSPNGLFTGKSITTPEYPYYIGFDSKTRFIQISSKQISIYK